MKKNLLTILALSVGMVFANANPVDVSKAKQVGQKFVQANFEQVRGHAELTLVTSGASKDGKTYYYAFNVGNEGFVLVSADDFYRPIIGYSDEGRFDAEINPNLAYKLNQMIEARSQRNLGEATPDVAAEWQMLQNDGKMMSRNGGREDSYLVQLKWNQDSPYNYFAPAATGGPGGRCYAGCVATAMGMIMKYWDHPLKGTGQHSYIWHGQTLSANFGETTYDWANMPVSISNASPEVEKVAIGTLLYHCGVAVDMDFAPDGSGTQSYLVPGAISSYFGYTNASVMRYRNQSSYNDWDAMLKESIDKGWPLYYSGCATEGCHAFVCDGYNDANLYHWNWGWGGSGDGWYDFDEMEYAVSNDAAVFNFVPAEVYNSTAQAPSNFTVTPSSSTALSAALSWTNPSKTLNNSNLSAISQIVVTRNGQVIYTQDNATPGATVNITDDAVPCYGMYDYKVYAVVNGAHGNVASAKGIGFGPSCNWTVIMSTTSFQGWMGASVNVYNACNQIVASATSTSSSANSVTMSVPLGNVKFGWKAPSSTVSNLTFTIKNASNQTVYNYTGSSADMPEGIFFSCNNDCGSGSQCQAPANLYASSNESAITLTWDGVSDKGYGYNVYRNGVLYRLVQENTFTDEVTALGGYCYSVRVLCEGGESDPTNEACATMGEGCDAPTNIWYELTSNNKPKITWEKPVPGDGLSGYYIYRKAEGEEWQLAKLVNPTVVSYTDNKTLENESWYYYKVEAYYKDIDCKSGPANNKYSDLDYFVRVYYSTDGIDEEAASKASIYPNPTSDKLSVKAEGMETVSVFNMLGQKVAEVSVNADQTEIDMNGLESGVYMVRIIGAGYEITKRVTVVK